MNNTLKVTITNIKPLSEEECEENSTEINLSFTIPKEKSGELSRAIENLGSNDADFFTENLLEALNRQPKTFTCVKPLTKLEAAVTNTLNELGIPAHTKGYRYLRDAIVYVTTKPKLIEEVTKNLYPSIAKNHNTTPIRVERAMRHAIESCCTNGNMEAVNAHFAYCMASKRGKPTNSEFIAVLSDELRMYA